MTCCHFGVKQGWNKMKLGMVTNFGTASSFFTLVFEIDEIFINYSCSSDMLSWHVVILVSNMDKWQWKLSWRLILGREIQLWRQFLKLTRASLIIHVKVTCCHFSVKHGQMTMKIAILTNFRTENSIMTSIFETDDSFINYSCKSDMLSF